MKSFTCPEEGCNERLDAVFAAERAAFPMPSKEALKHDEGVGRIYKGKCPIHGDVSFVGKGHHITMDGFVD